MPISLMFALVLIVVLILYGVIWIVIRYLL